MLAPITIVVNYLNELSDYFAILRLTINDVGLAANVTRTSKYPPGPGKWSNAGITGKES